MAPAYSELNRALAKLKFKLNQLRRAYASMFSRLPWICVRRSIVHYQRPTRAWAIITGSSAGIGLACAIELAYCGFNIILLGHKELELQQARDGIKVANPAALVEVIVTNCISASSEEIESAVRRVSHLEITVLVNNVGGMVPVPPFGIKSLHKYTAEEIDATINLNLRFMAHITRLTLPVLIRNEPALIISMSSQARFGCPFTAIYSGSKAFVASMSSAVNRESKIEGLDISAVAVISGEVQSESNSRPAPGMISAADFAKKLFNAAPQAAAKGVMEITPHWKHNLSWALFKLLPDWLRNKILMANLYRGAPDASENEVAP